MSPRLALLLCALVLAGCAGAPLRDQLPPGFQDLAPAELAGVRYERYSGRTPLSAVLAPVASRSFAFGWQALAAQGSREGGQVRVDVVFVGPPLDSGDPPLVQVAAGLFALDPPDLAHEGRVDLLPAMEVAPLLRRELVAGPDGVTYEARFELPAARLRWNDEGQAALLVSVVYRTADGVFVRENRDLAVGNAPPPEAPPPEVPPALEPPGPG